MADLFRLCSTATPKQFDKAIKKYGKDCNHPLRLTNIQSQTLLHATSEAGNIALLRHLITNYKLHDLINAQDRSGWAPLHVAADSGKVEVALALIQFGANVNIATTDNDSPLHYLVRKKEEYDTYSYFKLLKEFVAKGVLIDAQNDNGESPLHLSALKGQEEVISLLLNHSAQVNLKTRRGETPLHYAVRSGSFVCVTLLLNRNADIFVSGIEGTPRELAMKLGRRDIVEILEKAEGPPLTYMRNVVSPARGSGSGGSLIAPLNNGILSPPGSGPVIIDARAHPPPTQQRSASFLANAEQTRKTYRLLDYASFTLNPKFLPETMVTLPLSFASKLNISTPPTSSSSSSSSSAPLSSSLFLSTIPTYDFSYERQILAHIRKEREELALYQEAKKRYREEQQKKILALRTAAATTTATGAESIPPMPSIPSMTMSTPAAILMPIHGTPIVAPPDSATIPWNGISGVSTPASASSMSMTSSMTMPSTLGSGGWGAWPSSATTPPTSPFTNADLLPRVQNPSKPSPYMTPSPFPLPSPSPTPSLSPSPLPSPLPSPSPSVSPSRHHSQPVTPTPSKPPPRQRSASKPSPTSQPASAVAAPENETLYLMIISKHESLNPESVLVALKYCGNENAVLSYVQTYESLKAKGFTGKKVEEALKLFGGGALGLTIEEKKLQEEQIVSYLTLVQAGYEGRLVQSSLPLFNYDVAQTEKFLAAYRTVRGMGFEDMKVREALLLCDCDSEKAIRYLV